MFKQFIAILLLGFLLAGCVSAAADQSPNGGEVEPVQVNIDDYTPPADQDQEAQEAPAPGTRRSEAKLLHDVSLDLSKRLGGIDISQVMVLSSEKVTWESSGLGCPAADVRYQEEEVDGYRITLQAQGEEYIYHTRGLESFIWCDNGNPVEPFQD